MDPQADAYDDKADSSGVVYCGPNQSYRVGNANDAHDAWNLAGHADNPDAVRACVLRQVRKHPAWMAQMPQTMRDAMHPDGGKRLDADLTALFDAPAGRVEYKALAGPAAQIKILGPDDPGGAQHGLLAGYAAVFGNWDRSNEMILPGAFAPHLDAFLKDGFVAWNHNWLQGGRPIATPVQAYEDAHGLYTVSEFHSTNEAQEARTIAVERMARGKSVSQSVGYLVAKSDWVPRDDTGTQGKQLLDLPLLEHSLVTVPANPLAQVTAVKSGLPAGLPFGDEADSVLAALRTFVTRAADLTALRTKQGRMLSAANMDRLKALRGALDQHQQGMAEMCAMLDEMLDLAEPPGADQPAPAKSIDPAQLHALRLAFLVNEARRLGVSL